MGKAHDNAPTARVQVRYGWDDMPSLFYGTQIAVYNEEGLPATPGIYVVPGSGGSEQF